ncbi:MAG: Gfo/Idh/MocA family oxidoreductase [Verrucomicrobiae bacterium]|nr:Gfo/Idh/MocA family oxidoreductase [Verrucomicrobiae bacterium]
MHPQTQGLTRRRFLQRASRGAGALALAGAAQLLAASRERLRLRVAVIGCGGAGTACVGAAVHERLLALADVDERKLAAAWRAATSFGHQPRVFQDYRQLLETCGNSLEAVFIATPDHHHAPAAARCLALGIPVFVEKPLAHNLAEARALRHAARRAMVPTQMGNQGHSQDGYRLLCEHLWAGAIGPVRETHSLLERDPAPLPPSAPPANPPPWLAWDLWLGPAPPRPYQPHLHPAGWRRCVDLGTGVLGDLGCHVLDGVFWAFKLWQIDTYSVACLAQSPAPPGQHPRHNVTRWRIPARPDFPALDIFAYDSAWPPKIRALEQQLGEKLRGGTVYWGERGILFTGPNGEGPRFLPPSEHDAFPRPPKKIERAEKNAFREFLDACRGRPPAGSNFEMAGPLTEFVLTGVLAARLGPGHELTWDSRRLAVVGREDLQPLVRRSYRPGWEVEGVSA